MSFTLDNPYKRFVRMLARALYDGPPPLDNRKLKPGQSDNAGLAVLVVDALTREGWISDEDLNNQIKVPYKQLQRVLQCLENEKLITRKHCRKDTTGEREEGEGHKVKENERKKPQLIAYSSLEYAQAYDVLRYRILIIKTKLKPHSTYDSGRIPQFICSGCHFSYDPFNVIKLDQDGDNFICERCQKIVVEEEIEQDDGSTEKLKKFEEQLEPLTKQQAYLSTVKAPQFVPFHVWEAAKAAGTDKQAPEEETKPSKNEKKKLETKGVDAALREVLAPWMVKKEGDIVIEKEQTIQQSEPEVEEKKEESEEDIKKRQVQEEYLKAYYETLYNQQATVADVEDVGQKRKRRDSEEVEDEDSELKEAVKNDNQEGEEVASTTVDDNDDEDIWQDG